MPRFFFDFRQADDRVADTQGVELPDVEQAYLEVFTAAQEMWSELLKQRRDPRRCLFEVRSQDGDILFLFPLHEVVDCCTDNRKDTANGGDEHRKRQMRHQLAQTRAYAKRIRAEFISEVEVTRQVLRDSHALNQACNLALGRLGEDGER
jgi:hypothetical protein